MAAYYNELDPYAAQWLRNLISAGHIAPGVVDERSIEDIHPDDLREFTQCHFFAGIGVWSYALRLAGWPDDRPVWTGSCPCQPFSAAGQGAGFDDPRHLWPHFAWLIQERRPPVVFGEQVASKDAEPWLDLVQADLEAMAYAFGAVPFPAAGVGSPNIRDRLYWVANASCARLEERQRIAGFSSGKTGRNSRQTPIGTDFRDACGMADTRGKRRQQVARSAFGDENAHGSEGRNGRQAHLDNFAPGNGEVSGAQCPGPTNGLWGSADWLLCRDGKWRPVEPGTFPLAHGAPARVGRLRAYGNAINAQAAAQFIAAYLETYPQ